MKTVINLVVNVDGYTRAFFRKVIDADLTINENDKIFLGPGSLGYSQEFTGGAKWGHNMEMKTYSFSSEKYVLPLSDPAGYTTADQIYKFFEKDGWEREA